MITSQAKTLTAYMPVPNVHHCSGIHLSFRDLPLARPRLGWRYAAPVRNQQRPNASGWPVGKQGLRGGLSPTVSKGAPWFYGYACCPNYGNWSDHGYNWYNFSGTETHTFGPGMINEFRVGWDYCYNA